jgi:hypothetical protein
VKQTIDFVRCVACLVWDLVVKFCLLYRRLPGFADCPRASAPACDSDKSSCELPTPCESKPEPQVASGEEK